jgi:beta-glucosidase
MRSIASLASSLLRRFILSSVLIPALASALFSPTAAHAQDPLAANDAIEHRVDAMLSQLTLEQKLHLLGGDDSISGSGERSIALPVLKMSDGPLGVRSWGPSTAYGAGINLAASWDVDLAHRVGEMLGEDARARGVYFLLGPGMNIYRTPENGRNFEYFGEDPLLAGKIAAHYILGLQSKGVGGVAKHYAANNAEVDRGDANSVVDERTLREIYLPAFEASVKEGHVAAIMNSYNRVNGEHTTQSKYLNIDVLRKDWGVRGIVMSDWGATHDGVAAANGGLDLEMPSTEFMNPTTLLPAIKSGTVSASTIDEKVRRILRVALSMGFFDRDQTDLSIPLLNPQADAIALESAEEGAVLLKNDGNLLPLDRKRIRSIAVFGPGAYPAHAGGGGSSEVTAFAPVSILAGLSSALAPDIKVYWNLGVKSPESIFADSAWCADPQCKDHRLARNEYLRSNNEKIFSGFDEHVANWPQQELGIDDRTPRRVEWTGYFIPAKTGLYDFMAAGITFGTDLFKLKVDGIQAFERTHYGVRAPSMSQVHLEAGEPARIEFTYWPDEGQVGVGMGVVADDQLIDPQALQIGAKADAAVVAVGFDSHRFLEGEGSDRPYVLPGGQQKLIEAIAAINPHTIVTLNSGGSVATSDWIGKVPVFLETWYGGQQAGTAFAKILFGETNPSGKLPISWERRLEDSPAYGNFIETSDSKNVHYAEGIFVGYRQFDRGTVKPLFPFGFGLSYTTFAFSNLTVTPNPASTDGPITVAFDVKNTGQRAGADVAQVYVGEHAPKVPRPVKELKAFSRVMLAPSESRHLTVTLDRRALAYWDTTTHDWKVDQARFTIFAGDSSVNVPLQADFTVQ